MLIGRSAETGTRDFWGYIAHDVASARHAAVVVGKFGTRIGATGVVVFRESARGVLAFIFTLALLHPASTAWADDQEGSFGEAGAEACGRSRQFAALYAVDVSAVRDTGVLTSAGRHVVVTGAQADYAIHDPKRVSWTLNIRSLAWLIPLFRSGEADLAVQIAADWAAATPDPGPSALPAQLRAQGWTEGAVTRRLDVMTCLYAHTRDARLIPVVRALVAANTDPRRYRGLPHWAPHNHGAMANRALNSAAVTFDEPAWRDTAVSRLVRDFDSVFGECGMQLEQSSTYQWHNYQLWRGLAGLVAEAGYEQKASRMRERLSDAKTAAAKLTYPGGRMPMVGDSFDMPGIVLEDPGKTLTRLWCPTEGWAANRSSWNKPRVHYTLRFGPVPDFHGHNDHGSLTWWTDVAGGAVAIEDPGTPHRDLGAKKSAFASSLAMHNVLEPVGIEPQSSSTAIAQSIDGTDSYVVTTRSPRWGVERQRRVWFDLARARLIVRDTGSAARPIAWRQHWHLGEGWEPLPRPSGSAIARHANGSYLHIECDSGAGWKTPRVVPSERYPEWGAIAPGWDAVCPVEGKRVMVTARLSVTKPG